MCQEQKGSTSLYHQTGIFLNKKCFLIGNENICYTYFIIKYYLRLIFAKHQNSGSAWIIKSVSIFLSAALQVNETYLYPLVLKAGPEATARGFL